jgi:hypothetical protein
MKGKGQVPDPFHLIIQELAKLLNRKMKGKGQVPDPFHLSFSVCEIKSKGKCLTPLRFTLYAYKPIEFLQLVRNFQAH